MDVPIEWNADKNRSLFERYGVDFDHIVVAIDAGNLVGQREHPNKDRFPHQQQLLVQINDYVYVVPFVEDERGIFFKTLYPSRKAKAAFGKGKADD